MHSERISAQNPTRPRKSMCDSVLRARALTLTKNLGPGPSLVCLTGVAAQLIDFRSRENSSVKSFFHIACNHANQHRVTDVPRRICHQRQEVAHHMPHKSPTIVSTRD